MKLDFHLYYCHKVSDILTTVTVLTIQRYSDKDSSVIFLIALLVLTPTYLSSSLKYGSTNAFRLTLSCLSPWAVNKTSTSQTECKTY